MKEFKKWLENHKHANWTWEEDAEEAWRDAFALMLEWLEIEEPFEVFHARIKEELEDE